MPRYNRKPLPIRARHPSEPRMNWKPNVTVAAIAEREGRFLMVEEQTASGVRLNQPAGHLDEGESLLDAVVRETLEESAYRFVPRALVGIYQWTREDGEVTYLRFAFTGEISGHESGRCLDEGILRTTWMTAGELDATGERHRSPLVLRCVTDFLAGRRYPLDLISHLG